MGDSKRIEIDLLVGQFTENDHQELPLGVSFAGNYYQRKLRDILKIEKSLSLIYSDSNSVPKSGNGITYIVLHRNRHLHNSLSIARHLIRFILKERGGKTVLFYNLSFYSLFYYYYLRLFTRSTIVVILADAGFLPEKDLLSRFTSKSLGYAHGILALREMPELKLLRSKIEIMPGIITKNLCSNVSRLPDSVILSGSLGITTGLVVALEFFHKVTNLQLFITGLPYLMTNAEFIHLLSKYKSENIHYLGALDYYEYLRILCSVEFSLNLRNPVQVEHNYNFPSKIVEHMASGIIVISSIKYPELGEDTYIYTDFSVPGLTKCFEVLSMTSPEEKKLISNRAVDLVRKNFSSDVLINKITNLYSH